MIHKKRLYVMFEYVDTIKFEDSFYILPILSLVFPPRDSRIILKFGWLIFKVGIFFDYI